MGPTMREEPARRTCRPLELPVPDALDLPPTAELFRDDARLAVCAAHITALDEHGVQLDRTVFYPQGGGQAGDAGELALADGTRIAIADTRKGERAGRIVHVPAAGQADALARLRRGDAVTARIDWERRHRSLLFWNPGCAGRHHVQQRPHRQPL